MWCRDCHREVDVKAAGSACPLCGRALTASTRQTDDIRRAYEILERWQSSDLFERISTTAPLTTFKQQDRAPLLNIPLGKPAAPVAQPESVPPSETINVPNPMPVHEPVSERGANKLPQMPANLRVPRELLEPAREFVGVPVNARGSGRKEQLIWDLLVSPTPLMANVIPQISEPLQPSSAAVVPPTLVAGVSERPLRGLTPANSQALPTVIVPDAKHETETKRVPIVEPEVIDVDAAEVQAADARAIESKFEAENDTDTANELAPTDVETDHDDVVLTPTIETDTSSFAAEAVTESESAQFEVDEVVDATEEMGAADEHRSDREFLQQDHQDEPTARAAVDDLSHLETLFADLAQEEFTQGDSEPAVRETRSSVGASVVEAAAQFAASAEVSQTVLPVLMSSASVHEEPASLEFKSAESANDTKQTTDETTKKTQRSAIRRPPLHRRFQLERPVSESSAGSETVTRKLRLDQTGGNAETPQEKEPVTSLPSSVAPETKIVSNSPMPGKRFRIDKAESVEAITDTAGQRSRTHGRPRQRYIDEAHESQLRGPHFEVSAPKRSNLTSMTGQFLAYLGVLGLTVGTAMVIYGHFGGYSEITPTGWLVTTVAQMLLFLGVINLVSGGIEQNNDDVSRRINTLGEQLLRIEQVTSEVMRGPKIPAHMYAEDRDEDEVMESQRETAVVKR
jgi:hypothetical protein